MSDDALPTDAPVETAAVKATPAAARRRRLVVVGALGALGVVAVWGLYRGVLLGQVASGLGRLPDDATLNGALRGVSSILGLVLLAVLAAARGAGGGSRAYTAVQAPAPVGAQRSVPRMLLLNWAWGVPLALGGALLLRLFWIGAGLDLLTVLRLAGFWLAWWSAWWGVAAGLALFGTAAWAAQVIAGGAGVAAIGSVIWLDGWLQSLARGGGDLSAGIAFTVGWSPLVAVFHGVFGLDLFKAGMFYAREGRPGLSIVADSLSIGFAHPSWLSFTLRWLGLGCVAIVAGGAACAIRTRWRRRYTRTHLG